MKSMTCRELGGPCDEKLTAATWDEMVKHMTKHVMDKHPDTAKAMERMHNNDPEKWGRDTKPKWDAKPEAGLPLPVSSIETIFWKTSRPSITTRIYRISSG